MESTEANAKIVKGQDMARCHFNCQRCIAERNMWRGQLAAQMNPSSYTDSFNQ